MARWTASAKWAAGPALDGQRDMPLALRLSEGLGLTGMCGFGISISVAFKPLPRLQVLFWTSWWVDPEVLARHDL